MKRKIVAILFVVAIALNINIVVAGGPGSKPFFPTYIFETENELWLPVVKPNTLEEVEKFINFKLNIIGYSDIKLVNGSISPEFNTCKLVSRPGTQYEVVQDVKLHYTEKNNEIYNMLKQKSLELRNSNDIVIEDMEYIDYIMGKQYDSEYNSYLINKSVLNRDNTVRKILNDKNIFITCYLNNTIYDDKTTIYEGKLGLRYNYEGYMIDDGFKFLVKKVIYIPSDTPRTKEAIVNAVQKKLDENPSSKNKIVFSMGDIYQNFEGNTYSGELKYKSNESGYECNEYINVVLDSTKVNTGKLVEPEMTDIYKKISNNGTINLNAVKPRKQEEGKGFFVYHFEKQVDVKRWAVYFRNHGYDKNIFVNDDCAQARLNIGAKDDSQVYESRMINITYQDVNKLGGNHILAELNKIPDRFEIEDVETLKFINNNIKNLEEWKADRKCKFSSEYMNIVNKLNNMQVKRNLLEGSLLSNEVYDESGVYTVFEHNGTLYSGRYINFLVKHIIYVPTETVNTQDALIKAAIDRISPYGTVQIRYGGLCKDLSDYEAYKLYGYGFDLSNIKDYYIVTLNGKEYKYLILPDSSKMQNPKYINKDINTNFELNTTNQDFLMDTVLTVNKIISGVEYDNEIKTLNLKFAEIYDVKLYSKEKQSFITSFENGTVKVKLPIPTNLLNKELVVYGKDLNNNVKEYIPRIENGYAIFETNTLNRYIIGEKGKSENKDTKIEELVKQLSDKIPYRKTFKVVDLETINNLVNTKYNYDSIKGWEEGWVRTLLRYSTEFQNLISTSKIGLKCKLPNAGVSSQLIQAERYEFDFVYNDKTYLTRVDIFFEEANILYVPSDSKNLIKSAQKRVNEYLKNNNLVKISEGGLLKDLDSYELIKSQLSDYGINNIENYYIFNIKGKEYKFVIIKDSSKIQKPLYINKDEDTKVEVKTDNTNILVNTYLKVNKITSGKEYKKAIKKFDLEDGIIFDIKLNSKESKKNITKIKNGKVKVMIPISENFSKEDIELYDLETKKEVEIKIKNGYVIFETNKLGKYIIGKED